MVLPIKKACMKQYENPKQKVRTELLLPVAVRLYILVRFIGIVSNVPNRSKPVHKLLLLITSFVML